MIRAGFYNPEKRLEEINQRMKSEAAYFNSLDFSKGQSHVAPEQKKEERTLITIQAEVEQLRLEIHHSEFEGKHFNKQYRTFLGSCEKFLKQLDGYDYQHNMKHKAQRNNLIQAVNNITQMLQSKVHKDGKCCELCELKGTMWD